MSGSGMVSFKALVSHRTVLLLVGVQLAQEGRLRLEHGGQLSPGGVLI